MKRLIFLVCIAFLSFSLFSADITGHGEGSTREEALLMAREELLTSIRLSVSSETSVSVLDGEEGVESYFSESITSSSEGVLKGISESVQRKDNGHWTAVSSITEEKTYLYEKAVSDAIGSIDRCQKEIDKGLTQKEEISYLQIQLEQYELYDFYSDILLLLGHGTERKPVVGKEIVQSRFTVLFSKIESPATSGIDAEKAKAEIDEERALYEERKRISDQIAAEKASELEAYLAKLTESQKKTLENYQRKAYKSYVALEGKNKEKSFVSYVTQYVSARKTLIELFKDFNGLMEELNTSNENLITAQRNEVFGRAYDVIAEMKNGAPTAKAVAERTRIADIGTSDVIKAQNTLYRDAYNEFRSSSGKLFSVYDSDVKQVENTVYTVSSLSEGTSFIVGRYDASTCSWPFAFSYTVLDHPVTLTGTITADEVKKLWKASTNNWKKDAEYRSLVELYDAFFHSETSLAVTSDYSASLDPVSGKMEISILSCRVTRLDDSSSAYYSKDCMKFSCDSGVSGELSFTLSALGLDKAEASENAKSLFLSDSLASLSIHKSEVVDKGSFSISKITFTEEMTGKITEKRDSLMEEYSKVKTEAQKNSYGYASLLEKLDDLEKTQEVLTSFGISIPYELKSELNYRDTYRDSYLREKYAAVIKKGVSEKDLESSELDKIKSLEESLSSAGTTDADESWKSTIEEFSSSYDKLLQMREALMQDTLKSDAAGYSAEKIETGYRKLQILENEVLSKSIHLTLPSDSFAVKTILSGIDFQNMNIKVSVDADVPLLSGQEFTFPLNKIIGNMPVSIYSREAYYQNLLGTVCLLSRNSRALTVEISLSIDSDSGKRSDDESSYTPFSRSTVLCTYVITDSLNDTVLAKGSSEISEFNGTALSSIEKEKVNHAEYEARILKDKENKKKELKRKISEAVKNRGSLKLNLEMSDSWAITGCGLPPFGQIITFSYGDYIFYGGGFDYAFSIEDRNLKAIIGLEGNAGFRTPNLLPFLTKFHLDLKAGARAALFMDGWKPTASGGFFCGIDILFFYNAEKVEFIGISTELGLDFLTRKENTKRMRLSFALTFGGYSFLRK